MSEHKAIEPNSQKKDCDSLFDKTIIPAIQKKTTKWLLSTMWRIIQRLCLRTERELVSAFAELYGPTEFNAVWKLVGSVGGFSTDRAESLALYSLAKNGPGKGVIVEVGSYLGRSTAFLACGSKVSDREKVISIDPHRAGTGDPDSEDNTGITSTYPLFMHNLRRLNLDDWVIPLITDANKATTAWEYGIIRLLFIDGLHSYESVKTEISCFVPLLSPNAVVVFDDYYPPEFPGIAKAVSEAKLQNLLPSQLIKVNRYAVVGLKSILHVIHN